MGLEPDPEASFILLITSRICHPPEVLPSSPEDEGVCFHCPCHYSESICCGFKHLQEHSLWSHHQCHALPCLVCPGCALTIQRLTRYKLFWEVTRNLMRNNDSFQHLLLLMFRSHMETGRCSVLDLFQSLFELHASITGKIALRSIVESGWRIHWGLCSSSDCMEANFSASKISTQIVQ